jgi:hypothetical protein
MVASRSRVTSGTEPNNSPMLCGDNVVVVTPTPTKDAVALSFALPSSVNLSKVERQATVGNKCRLFSPTSRTSSDPTVRRRRSVSVQRPRKPTKCLKHRPPSETMSDGEECSHLYFGRLALGVSVTCDGAVTDSPNRHSYTVSDGWTHALSPNRNGRYGRLDGRISQRGLGGEATRRERS